MKIKTSELMGAALDWAVAKAIGEYKPVAVPAYSTDWSQGGPIIERENLQVTPERGGGWVSSIPYAVEMGGYRKYIFTYGPTPLIAAMRCYVASKLGDEVEIPKELKGEMREALADNALDKMAENARELGLDYEPARKQEQKLEFVSPGGGYVPAIPRPMPLDWKLVPRKATPEMLKAMDECAQEGYDERLYEGMASSVYMAAWDASPVIGTLPEQPAQQQEPEKVGRITANVKDMVLRQEVMLYTDDYLPIGTAIYTSPPASKPWVGLTTADLDEIDAPIRERGSATIAEIYRAIEAKLREKNAPQQSKEDA